MPLKENRNENIGSMCFSIQPVKTFCLCVKIKIYFYCNWNMSEEEEEEEGGGGGGGGGGASKEGRKEGSGFSISINNGVAEITGGKSSAKKGQFHGPKMHQTHV